MILAQNIEDVLRCIHAPYLLYKLYNILGEVVSETDVEAEQPIAEQPEKYINSPCYYIYQQEKSRNTNSNSYSIPEEVIARKQKTIYKSVQSAKPAVTPFKRYQSNKMKRIAQLV